MRTRTDRSIFRTCFVLGVVIAAFHLVSFALSLHRGEEELYKGAWIMIFTALSTALMASLLFKELVKATVFIAFSISLISIALNDISLKWSVKSIASGSMSGLDALLAILGFGLPIIGIVSAILVLKNDRAGANIS